MGHAGLPGVGFFVECGAADGHCSSNTWWLEKAKGWTGILVEADPRWTITNRIAIVERLAIGPGGPVSFGTHLEPALSGIARECPNRIKIPSITLTELLERHHVERVDVLSIDTEGTELDVWRTLDLSRWRPRLVIVEWNTLGMPWRCDEILNQFDRDGYSLKHATLCNFIYRDATNH